MRVLVVQTYERSKLVLEHRFFGETTQEASSVYRAHLKTDSFLRACVEAQNFRGIPCSTRTFWIEQF